MKAKFLKMAGVKNESEFYKKYPTEAAFFKAHPEAKELKKAYGGWDSLGLTVGQALNKKGSENPFQNPFAKDNLQATTAAIPGIVGGVQSVKDARKRTADLKTMANVSDIQLKAAMTTPEPIRKRINRPEMYASRPDQLFPSQGTGYDAAFAVGKHGTTLKAEDGMQIGGNLTEIQNMYNPGDLYSDLGYEPLSESDIVKQYADGGLVPKATQGFDANMAGTIGTGFINAFAGASPESNLGGQIGGLFGPLGGFVGTAIGKAFGAKREGEEAFATGNLQRNMGQIQGIQKIRGIHSQNSSVMNNGGNVPQAEVGWVSHDWQPQVIAKWGDVNVEDVDDIFRPADMKTLEHGGLLKAQNGLTNLPYGNYEERVERFRDIMRKYSDEELNKRATTQAGLAEYAKLYPNEPFTLDDISFFQDYTTKVLDPQTQAFMQRRGTDWKPGTERSKTDAIWGPKTQKQKFANLLIKPVGTSEFTDLGTVRKGFDTTRTANNNLINTIPSTVRIGGKTVSVTNIDGKPYFKNPSTGDTTEFNPNYYRPETGQYYRTGGNIRQNYLSELDNFNFGGNLKTHWGGRAEVDSYNPYLPGTGETVMFKGNQHSESDGKGRTGIGVSYGPKEHDSYTDYAEYGTEQAADVEVENGEPAIQLPESGIDNPMQKFAMGGQQGSKDLSMTVYGALPINKHVANLLQDNKVEGLTYKRFIAEKNKEENKANKGIKKATEGLENLKVITPFDRLEEQSYKANFLGNDKVLERIAQQKVDAAMAQNTFNELADEFKLDPKALIEGKLKPSKDTDNAKYGIKKAQVGVDYTGPSIVDYLIKANLPSSFKARKKLAEEKGIKNYRGTASQNTKLLGILRSESSTAQTQQAAPAVSSPAVAPPPATTTSTTPAASTSATTKTDTPADAKNKKSKTDWGDVAKTLALQLPSALKRQFDEPFDYLQTIPEVTAITMNQPEGVNVQLLQPLLTQPFQVSLDDQKLQIKSSYANSRRMVGNNPAAQALIAAKESEDLNKVNAEEFRLNQGIMAESVNKNREILNAVQQANAAALDEQYVRQETGESKRKATYLEALKSMVSKEAQHNLDLRTLNAYSNLFPQFGFDSNMRTFVQNPTLFENPVVGAAIGNQLLTEIKGQKKNKKKDDDEEKEEDAKFGKRLKKQINNGSIVKSLKNI